MSGVATNLWNPLLAGFGEKPDEAGHLNALKRLTLLLSASDYGSLKYTKEILVQDSESCFRRDLPVLCES